MFQKFEELQNIQTCNKLENWQRNYIWFEYTLPFQTFYPSHGNSIHSIYRFFSGGNYFQRKKVVTNPLTHILILNLVCKIYRPRALSINLFSCNFFPLKSKFTEKNALTPLVFPEISHLKKYYFPVCKIKLIPFSAD